MALPQVPGIELADFDPVTPVERSHPSIPSSSRTAGSSRSRPRPVGPPEQEGRYPTRQTRNKLNWVDPVADEGSWVPEREKKGPSSSSSSPSPSSGSQWREKEKNKRKRSSRGRSGSGFFSDRLGLWIEAVRAYGQRSCGGKEKEREKEGDYQTEDDGSSCCCKMKFAHSIQLNAVPEWSPYYIAYSNLKKLCVFTNLLSLSLPCIHSP